MANMTDYLIPLLLLGICILALHQQENAYGILLEGAGEGLKLMGTLVPSLVLLLTAVTMLRASGAMTLLEEFCTPLFSCFGIPP